MAQFDSPRNSSSLPYYISNGKHSNKLITSTNCRHADTVSEISQFRSFLHSSWNREKEDPIEYFRRLITEIICDTSPRSYEEGVPRYFSTEFIQHVDGKILTYNEFISHQKAQKTQVVGDSVEVSWQELHAHFYPVCNDQKEESNQGKKDILNITSSHTVKMTLKENQVRIIGSCVSLIKIDVKTGKIFQCNEFTHIGEEMNGNSNNMEILNKNWETFQNSN